MTVVGMEVTDQGETYFLIFDPMKSANTLLRGLEKGNTKPLRLKCQALLQKDCQLVLTSTLSLSKAGDFERLKRTMQVATAASAAVLRATG